MKAKYNIHEAINYRSHRKGLVNYLNFKFKAIQYSLTGEIQYPLQINTHPANTYGIYYPNVYGKKHSQYPKK